MKNVLSLIVAFVALTVATLAQDPAIATLPGDPGAILMGRITMTTEVRFTYFGKEKGERVGHEIMVWRTSGGGVEYVVNTATIVPTTGVDIDFIPTKEIFRQVATNAVAEGARLGFMAPQGTQPTKVWYESNVERTGSGLATRFGACAIWQPVARTYSVSFTDGVATVTDLTTTNYPSACGTPSGSVQ